MLAARCLRAASSSARAFYSSIPYADASSLTAAANTLNLLDSLSLAQPPVPGTNTGPPVGTVHPPPKGPPPPRNPLDARILRNYDEKKPCYSLYCQSTRNNTITTLMDEQFKPVASFSGGSCGFKKVNRSTYEAGYQCATRMFLVMEEAAKKHDFDVHLYLKGFGQGRDAMQRALMTSEGENVRSRVICVTDRTPIKIGGTRAKKARRL
ncbi:hypothetical protein C0991_006005 [Blastosporella zonata]|nr:hypothetical protein C0991_006005 [Blastosporella zonata]